MSHEEQIFVANVVVIDLTWNAMAMNVINWLAGVIVELNAIVKIHKYRGLHEGHHFILVAMEVHDALGHDMDCFIRECACLFSMIDD